MYVYLLLNYYYLGGGGIFFENVFFFSLLFLFWSFLMHSFVFFSISYHFLLLSFHFHIIFFFFFIFISFSSLFFFSFSQNIRNELNSVQATQIKDIHVWALWISKQPATFNHCGHAVIILNNVYALRTVKGTLESTYAGKVMTSYT